MNDFAAFKSGHPAQSIFRAMHLSEHLSAADSWRELCDLIVDFNHRSNGGFVENARKYDGVASSGERVLLHAILFATDFAWLADELTEGRAWRRMGVVNGAYRAAVAACIGGE